MPTESTLSAIVFAPTTSRDVSWHAARTTRALARLGIHAVTAFGTPAIVERLATATSATWLVRAGAIPIAVPRMPPASATGRSLVAFGSTEGDAQWSARLAATGGDLARATEASLGLPSVRSVVVENPALFAEAIDASSSDAISDASFRIAADARIRAVRIPGFDVAFTEPVHVLELVTTLHRGGAERIVLDLARELEGLGVEVTLAVLDRASRTTFDVPEGAVFLDELADGRGERLEALGDLAKARGIDLIHAHLVNGDDLQLLAQAGIPVVTTIHNSRPGWPIRMEVLRAGDVALAIACSRDVEQQLRDMDFPSVVRTIWNGIATKNASARDASTDDEKSVRMLAVANYRPQKRLERLPTVVAELRSRGCDASLVIAGEPIRNDPEMVAIEGFVRQEAARLGVTDAIDFVGSRADVESLYNACNVVVSTSAFEGLSLVHLEALAAGLPLITTAVAGTEELALKHPHAHVLPLNASPSQFAETILSSLERARARARARARSSLSPDFTSRQMAERHTDLFSRVLHSRSPSPTRRGGLVLIANNFSTGGAQSSARRLLTTLAASGVAVRAIVIQEQDAFPTPGRAALLAAGIEVLVAPRAGDVDPLVTAQAVARSIDDAQPDAILFWNVISQHKVLIADLLWGIPIWDVSPGEMYFTSFEKYLAKPRVGSPYLAMKDYGRRLAGAVVKYEAERARAESMLGVEVQVVPNGVIVPAVAPSRPQHDNVVIGTLARLGVDKKLEQLIEAVAHAQSRGLFESCELQIAGGVETGDEDYVETLRERAKDLPITWVGERDSATFLAGLDLFAMVSEPSGCPNASIEAMAAGLAVVATDVGGASEQIVHGETGLLVPRGDSAALGEAIAELARDPSRRAAMGRAGHARALERFDVRRMATDYARICLGISVSPLSMRDAAPTSPRHHEPGTRVQVTTTSV